ncbi:hypothetical protein CR513_58368, partial [Mucuna pruriens]
MMMMVINKTKWETYDNKTLDLFLGNFDLHGLVLSELKQSVKENYALVSLINFSIALLSPFNDLLSLLDNLFNDWVKFVEYFINPLLILSKLELLQGPDEVNGAVSPLEKLLGDVKGLLGLCTLGQNSQNLADLLGPQGPQLVDGGGVEKVVHDEFPDELPVRSKGNHGHRVVVSSEPRVEGRSLVGLKEKFEQFRGGGNNGGHRPKVERIQRTIAFRETVEGVVENGFVQKVKVSNEWKTRLWTWRVSKVAKGLRFCTRYYEVVNECRKSNPVLEAN